MNDARDHQRAELRQRMRTRRQQLSPRQRMLAAQGLRHTFEHWPAFAQCRNVAGYWACDGEVPLNLLVATLETNGQQYWLPQIAAGQQLKFARWRSGEAVVANRYGIPEPAADAEIIAANELDLILLPLLAFDARGNRLGTGGGYYDRSLAFLNADKRPPKPLLVGVAHAFQQVDRLVAQTWDVPLDLVATDHQLIVCKKSEDTE